MKAINCLRDPVGCDDYVWSTGGRKMAAVKKTLELQAFKWCPSFESLACILPDVTWLSRLNEAICKKSSDRGVASMFHNLRNCDIS